jgi:hypothetical protein
VQLATQDRHVVRGVDSEFHAVAFHAQDRDRDVFSDAYVSTSVPAKDQQGILSLSLRTRNVHSDTYRNRLVKSQWRVHRYGAAFWLVATGFDGYCPFSPTVSGYRNSRIRLNASSSSLNARLPALLPRSASE